MVIDSDTGVSLRNAIGIAHLEPCPMCSGNKFVIRATYRGGEKGWHDIYSSRPKFAIKVNRVPCPSCRGSGKWIDSIRNLEP